ncbi:gp33 family protein [Caldanaerobius polysaccharolyticus]|uniref:gp33 family protein n=1 Tax=Caldanaerobius polysaccharolyticus TaxID=44256 RepID=UPI000478F96F|nr:hypothetical protein [Caldanaerobius polysaccharolyticus]
MEIFELAEKLKSLRERKKALEEEAKNLSHEIEETEAELTSRMIESEMQSFQKAGTLFYLNTKVFASPIPEKKQQLFQALKDNGYGDLVYETVNSNSLSAFVKEQIEQNEDKLPEWLDGLVNVYDKVTIGMRKAK